MTARDFAQTLELLRALRDRAHARSATTAASASARRRVGLAAALARRSRGWARGARRFDLALGHGSNDVSVAAAPAAASPARRCSTTSGRPSSTTSTAASRRGRRARRDPGRAPRALRRARQAARAMRGSRRSTTSPTSSPTRRVLERARARPAAADRRRAHAAGGVALPPLRERPLRRGAAAPATRPPTGVQPVVLPRTDAQREELRRVAGFLVPERAIDAQSLIAYADLVVSAGGTMNREAVALGTPVYTIFEGRLGRRRRAPDRRGPPAPARATPRARCWASAPSAPAPRRACGATRELLVDLLLIATLAGDVTRPALRCRRRRLPLQSAAMRRRIRSAAFPLHRHSLPQLAGRRGPGRARVLPRLPAALRAAARTGAATRTCANARSGGSSLLERCSCSSLFARLPAALALRRPARLRGGRAARSSRSSLLTVVADRACVHPVHRATRTAAPRAGRAAERRDRRSSSCSRSCSSSACALLARTRLRAPAAGRASAARARARAAC